MLSIRAPRCLPNLEDAMQATRLYLTTDNDGRVLDLPLLPPNARLEAILLVVETPQTGPTKRIPSPRIAGLGTIHGDLIAPVVDAEDWEALR